MLNIFNIDTCDILKTGDWWWDQDLVGFCYLCGIWGEALWVEKWSSTDMICRSCEDMYYLTRPYRL